MLTNFQNFLLADSVVNLQQTPVQLFHHILNMSLHYLVKYLYSKNHNAQEVIEQITM